MYKYPHTAALFTFPFRIGEYRRCSTHCRPTPCTNELISTREIPLSCWVSPFLLWVWGAMLALVAIPHMFYDFEKMNQVCVKICLLFLLSLWEHPSVNHKVSLLIKPCLLWWAFSQPRLCLIMKLGIRKPTVATHPSYESALIVLIPSLSAEHRQGREIMYLQQQPSKMATTIAPCLREVNSWCWGW